MSLNHRTGPEKSESTHIHMFRGGDIRNCLFVYASEVFLGHNNGDLKLNTFQRSLILKLLLVCISVEMKNRAFPICRFCSPVGRFVSYDDEYIWPHTKSIFNYEGFFFENLWTQ